MKNYLLGALFLFSVFGGYSLGTNLHTKQFGAALPQAVAVFETSLAAPISSSATSMTLTANAIRGGGALSGFNCFTIDEGSAQAETICGTVSGTTVSSLTRGVSQSTGTTTVAALQFAHRRGANVKITDFPVIQIMKAQLNGEDTIPNLLNYANTVLIGAGSASTTIATKYYVDNVALVSAPDANETTKGVSELATAAELAAGTSLGGTGARLVIPASQATSTPNASTATGAIATSIGRYLSQAWLDLTANFTFTGAVNIAATLAKPLTLNGLAYVFPASQPASATSTLQNDGNGNLSWGQSLVLLTSTTTTTAMEYATTSWSGSYAVLRVIFYSDTLNSNGSPSAYFNSDRGANYGSSALSTFGATVSNTTYNANTSLQLNNNIGTTSPLYMTMDIANYATRIKPVHWRASMFAGGAQPPYIVVGDGQWNNTSAAITGMVFYTGGAGSLFPVGTTIKVFGSN